jgi:hypothetical protein
VATRGWVIDAATARQLVGFLPMFAAALPVSLSRNRPVAAERPPDFPQRQCNIDEGKHVVDAVRLLLGATRCKHHRGASVPQHTRALDNLRLRNSSERLDALRPIRSGNMAYLVETLGSTRDVRGIDQRLANQ